MSARQLVAGNWKMNGLKSDDTVIKTIGSWAVGENVSGVDILICLPASLLNWPGMHGARMAIGGEDCHANAAGAHTGHISAEMIADAGGKYVIVGHSERRADDGEIDGTVNAKAQAGWRAGLISIICVGETEAERDAGQTLDVIGRQLDGSVPGGATAKNSVVAYEPVWAIGTGRTPTLDEIEEVHAFIRERLSGRMGADAINTRLLYGGSVKPANAVEIAALANVDGALVGGASLKADDFIPIIAAFNG